MKRIVFIVEKTSTGYSAYAKDFENIPAGTTGDTMTELRTNIVDAYNSVAEFKGWPEVTIDEITVQLDLPQFFQFYNVINISALSVRIGMSNTLLSQYIHGQKKAGPKQIARIMTGIKDLGKELASLEIAV
ncbi:XRE family transcriptional regulator [Pedobacter nutrimenti]|uniref:Pilus assembly protein HicB n=1 Tax=Pedobacter nutrimenti TaxID=1241337 RepID=A0A318UTU8_9SPHI|nr:XRE family transcriptional regulator [Pedobacter nutrimenti]PYF75059.1 hypothetical protein B0O44_103506 [Pedobacter nutrimenti]